MLHDQGKVNLQSFSCVCHNGIACNLFNYCIVIELPHAGITATTVILTSMMHHLPFVENNNTSCFPRLNSVAVCLPRYSVWQSVAEASGLLVIVIAVQQPMHRQLGIYNLYHKLQGFSELWFTFSVFVYFVFPNVRIQFMLHGFVH